ncbi:unnamed protein product [Rotaria sordida]|uniref:Transmembrane protein n=1 Tax=Rotaria sordida TaxID=392033 RepID=A0A819EYL0_9BILA|nr:unnamed protein product [Rotaria sordida]CAF3858471.1 unnamed protein product [Rotaria sordida]
MYVYSSLFSIFFILLFSQCVSLCKNFLVQHCTDITIGFESISKIKCIQLIPIQFDLSFVYSVENYIILKINKCYNIVSYNSSQTILFSNECRELCFEQYCLLFDNQSNRSIINIFYSQSLNYQEINSITNNISSYDYFLFDKCSTTNRINKILIIIVYVLVAIIVLLTIVVILKYCISYKLNKDPNYDPYAWRWIIDCFLCQIRQENEHERNSNIIEDYNQSRIEEDQSFSKNNLVISIPIHTIIRNSTNNTQEQRNHESQTSRYSTNQHYPGVLYRNSSQDQSKIDSTEYLGYYKDLDDDNLPDAIENHNHVSLRPQSLLDKSSSEVHNALSLKSSASEYEVLEDNSSPSLIIIRL